MRPLVFRLLLVFGTVIITLFTGFNYSSVSTIISTVTRRKSHSGRPFSLPKFGVKPFFKGLVGVGGI